jgi:hypothetical protein
VTLNTSEFIAQELEIKKAAFLKSLVIKNGLEELPFDAILAKSQSPPQVDSSLLKEWSQASIGQTLGTHLTSSLAPTRVIKQRHWP